MRFLKIFSVLIFPMITACSQESVQQQDLTSSTTLAKIVNVECKGQPNNYTFSVSIESEETGCDQYADWWEVITADSILIYRRVLSHSHVNEQPFTRSGGIIDVGADEFVYVRAHMNKAGYGDIVFSGTPRAELTSDTLPSNFAASVASMAPLPDGCDF